MHWMATLHATAILIGTFGPTDPIRFKFDGGEGLVMPMKPDEEVPK